MQKFAELIVRECMHMCDVAQWGCITHGWDKQAQGCQSAQEYIAEHFGVEEQSTETNEWHTCPYAEEIHNDYETLCDCDEEQQRRCAMDV
jgi:hypothetical protein